MYKRKTTDEFSLWGNYDGQWCYLCSDDTRKGIRRTKREYQENENGIVFLIKRKRVPIVSIE